MIAEYPEKIIVRVSKETKEALASVDNYSDFVRRAITMALQQRQRLIDKFTRIE